MKTKKLSIIALVIMLSMLTYITPFPTNVVKAQSSSVYHTFWIDPISHDDYGLAYPVTYEFSIPSGVSNLEAYRRFTLEENWVQIVEKTSADFFNGIEAVRFDYANNRAYVSISFISYSDCIHLCFADSDGNEISTEFLGITSYYDDRRVAAVFTIDDLGEPPPWGDNITKVSTVFADAQVWWTGAIPTINIDSWQELQECVNRGYFEVASHSVSHPNETPYEDYDWEIGGSKDDIITNLNLPNLYKKGSKQYVWCWVEPSGASDDMVQQKLGEYKYLISRTCDETYGSTYYEQWNPDFGIYDRASTSIAMDWQSLEEINNVFDSVYAAGGIYHTWGHPGQLDWEPGGKAFEVIQHIKGKKDVWYVGFGALYAYDYTRMHVKATSIAITPNQVKMYVGQSQTFSSSVLGGTPPYSYQWYLSDIAVPSANSSTWKFTPRTTGRYKVYLSVTDGLSFQAHSNVANVFVYSMNLLLTVEPNQATYTKGHSTTFTVTVFNEANPALESSLTLTVTGPNNYYHFDFQRINVEADTIIEYSFTLVIPDVAGTYVVEVNLVPSLLAAYDTVWLETA